MISIGTQSDISAETFKIYEAKINEKRNARKNICALKLNEKKLVKKNKMIDNHEFNELTDSIIEQSNKITKFVLKSNNVVAQTVKFTQSLNTILCNNNLAKFCFGCSLLLVIGFLSFTLFYKPTESNPMLVNNYKWSFGLHLDYKRGPPPI